GRAIRAVECGYRLTHHIVYVDGEVGALHDEAVLVALFDHQAIQPFHRLEVRVQRMETASVGRPQPQVEVDLGGGFPFTHRPLPPPTSRSHPGSGPRAGTGDRSRSWRKPLRR